MTTLTIEPPVIETSRRDLEAAFYGICRLVAGFQDWKPVEPLPNDQKISALIDQTTTQFQKATQDLLNVDPKQQNQLMRKMKAYQQLALIEKFCFKEVIWDD